MFHWSSTWRHKLTHNGRMLQRVDYTYISDDVFHGMHFLRELWVCVYIYAYISCECSLCVNVYSTSCCRASIPLVAEIYIWYVYIHTHTLACWPVWCAVWVACVCLRLSQSEPKPGRSVLSLCTGQTCGSLSIRFSHWRTTRFAAYLPLLFPMPTVCRPQCWATQSELLCLPRVSRTFMPIFRDFHDYPPFSEKIFSMRNWASCVSDSYHMKLRHYQHTTSVT